MTDLLKDLENNYHIVNSNFRDKFPEIVKNIKKAAAISLDSEFSGLFRQTKFKNSLFDSGAERYNVLKTNIDGFIIIQIGLTAFCFDRDENRYKAHMYNFYLFPRSIASVDHGFFCQSSSLQFLAKNGFDFNKFVKEGIPYLNDEDEKTLTKDLACGTLFQQIERKVAFDDEKFLQKIFSGIREWNATAQIGEELILDDTRFVTNEITVYLVQKEIRTSYSDLWSSCSSSKIIVKKIDANERKLLVALSTNSLENDILDYFLGFTKIFRLLVSLKKPIIGHNLLIDLMIMHKQFYQPLPNNYKTFKKNILSLFPKIFDTKFISYELKKVLSKEDAWVSNAVLDLYRYFSEGKGREATLYRPEVMLWMQDSEILDPDILLHEAGWDSFISGYCFLQMGHYFACATYGPNGYRRPLSSIEHINGVTKFMNRVNVIRALISHVNFEGDDPVTNRPPILLVKLKESGAINLREVTEMLAKYCSVDVKLLNKSNALVIVSNFPSARQILKDFLKNKKYKIKVYHPIRDSKVIRMSLWFGFFLSSAVCVGALINVVLKK